jgi:selT/selW/selH-like putative selenoprotein
MSPTTQLPRVAITYCTQCKWLLRAAYFAQELLSTFGTSIGEVALIPATGGLFTVHLTHVPPGSEEGTQAEDMLLWDRKAEGGFPETKILKQRLRNHIEPGRDLGHSDKPSIKSQTPHTQDNPPESADNIKKECEDCK